MSRTGGSQPEDRVFMTSVHCETLFRFVDLCAVEVRFRRIQM